MINYVGYEVSYNCDLRVERKILMYVSIWVVQFQDYLKEGTHYSNFCNRFFMCDEVLVNKQ